MLAEQLLSDRERVLGTKYACVVCGAKFRPYEEALLHGQGDLGCVDCANVFRDETGLILSMDSPRDAWAGWAAWCLVHTGRT